MWFPRLPKLKDISERELAEMIADWMNTKSVQNTIMSFAKML